MKAYPYMHKHPTTGQTTISEGMDLRDYFAGLAMQKLMGSADVDDCCQSAYTWADAMMKQRNNKEVPNEHHPAE